jgi:hypothetical protein
MSFLRTLAFQNRFLLRGLHGGCSESPLPTLIVGPISNMFQAPGQMFRRKCFEAVGGYVPIKGGATDWVAVTTARMKGWKTRTFVEKVCFHYRKIGTGNHSH